MNSLTVVTIAAILIAMGPLALTLYQTASAQYTTGQDTGALSVEEQLRLAKEKVSNAQQAGAYGSGTAFFGKNIGDAAIYTGAIVAIFEPCTAAFIVMSRHKIRKRIALLYYYFFILYSLVIFFVTITSQFLSFHYLS